MPAVSIANSKQITGMHNAKCICYFWLPTIFLFGLIFQEKNWSNMQNSVNSCQTCAFLMESESSKSGFRCGHEYFILPPRKRVAVNMRIYKTIVLDNVCSKWQQHSPSVLRDKFL